MTLRVSMQVGFSIHGMIHVPLMRHCDCMVYTLHTVHTGARMGYRFSVMRVCVSCIRIHDQLSIFPTAYYGEPATSTSVNLRTDTRPCNTPRNAPMNRSFAPHACLQCADACRMYAVDVSTFFMRVCESGFFARCATLCPPLSSNTSIHMSYV